MLLIGESPWRVPWIHSFRYSEGLESRGGDKRQKVVWTIKLLGALNGGKKINENPKPKEHAFRDVPDLLYDMEKHVGTFAPFQNKRH